jgi:hypothetical protein
MGPYPLPSILFITLLLTIGLFFFLRGSIKDRTTTLILQSPLSEGELIGQLQQYFSQRAYRLINTDPQAKTAVFEGFVQPSWFLAIFLSLLAGIGLLCLALVLNLAIPQGGLFWLGLTTVAPVTGWVYWRRAGRLEQVSLQLKPPTPTTTNVRVTGHRDELIALQASLPLELLEAE